MHKVQKCVRICTEVHAEGARQTCVDLQRVFGAVKGLRGSRAPSLAPEELAPTRAGGVCRLALACVEVPAGQRGVWDSTDLC